MPRTGSTVLRNKAAPDAEYQLMLFVTGATPNSLRAVANVKRICEEHLAGRYRLDIIDVYQQKELAASYQLVALPLLIKRTPLPERKMIGDFSDEVKVLAILNII